MTLSPSNMGCNITQVSGFSSYSIPGQMGNVKEDYERIFLEVWDKFVLEKMYGPAFVFTISEQQPTQLTAMRRKYGQFEQCALPGSHGNGYKTILFAGSVPELRNIASEGKT